MTVKQAQEELATSQQAKEAGITDYIPGWTNLNRAHLTHIDAQGLAAANKGINSPFLQDMVDKKRAAAIKELGIGGAKLLGTGLAVGGAAYGAKKLYNRMTDNKTQEKVSAAMQKYAENELALWGPPREGDLGSRVREMKNLNRQFQKLLIKHYDARTAAQLRDTPGMSNDIFDPNQVGSHVAEVSRRQRNLVRRGLIGAQEGNKFPGGWAIQGGTRSSPQIFTRGFSSQSGMHSPIVGLPYYTAGAKPIVVPQQVTDLVHVPSSAGGAGGGALVGGGPLSLPSGGGVPTWAKALGGLALAGGAAYGGKKLYDKYKAKQQAKEAGIIDYIPGGRNLDNAYLAYGNAKRYADAAKSGTGLANALGSNYVQGLADKYRADAIGELRTGAPKVLGTGLAVGGALYGAKKLYNHMTNNKAQEKVSAYMMKYAQEEMATSPQLPDYGRNALRGAGIGALAGGISAAGAGALGGYNLGRSFGSGGSNALITGMGAAHGGVAGALGGAGLGTLIGLGATAIQRQRIADQIAQQATAQQQAAKQAAYEFAKLAQEEEATRNLPGYGRGILRGAGKGALTGAGLGALAGGSYAMGSLAHEALVPGVHNPMRDIAFLSGAGALTGALAGTGVGALKGGIRTALQRRALAQQAKEAGIADYIPKFIPGVSDLRRAKTTLQGAAINRALIDNIVADSPDLANYESVKGLSHLTDLDEQLGRRLTAIGGAKLLGTGLAAAGAAYGGKKLYDRYKANQQTKEAGIADYIPGVSDLRNARSLYANAADTREFLNTLSPEDLNKIHPDVREGLSRISGIAEAVGRRRAIIGGAKLLGTGLATAGAAYGGKKLYDMYKAKQQAKEAAALPPSLGGEIGKHLLLAGAATLGGVAVQKGLSVASAALDKLEKPKNLARMMAVAPELRALDPQKVSLAYDSIAAISPQLVKDPLVGASVLKRHVQATDLSALRSAADLYRSPDPAVGSLLGSALTRAADKGYGSYEKKLEAFNSPKKP